MRLSHVYFTPAMNTRHMPRLHAKMASIVRKPFTSFAKIPTRDPEILPCYWLYVVRNLYLQSKYTHISIHTRSHATGKIILVSCTHTFQKLILHLFSPPQMFYINQGRKWKVCLYLHQGTYHQLQKNIVFFESIFDMNFLQ